MARTWIIVPAAGGGSRFGSTRPKQYAHLAGKPMIERTLQRLATLDAAGVVVALAPDDHEFALAVEHRPRVHPLHCGGATRAETVRNALHAMAPRCMGDDWIAVHDAARPCVPRDALARLATQLRDDPVGGLLAIPLADTLKRAASSDRESRVAVTEARAGLWLAQTPQMFRFDVLARAYAIDGALECTDEAQAVEALAATGACAMPHLVQGSAANIKVTWPEDLALAAAILASQETE
jgi:2-C-methyl-D-erythritol 4-phosphate cytidylyltransferase